MGDKRTGHRVFMLAFIAAPLVVLAVLVYAMTVAMERGPSMVAEPVGAGAGTTGGANAIGEAVFGSGDSGGVGMPAEQAARGVVLVVHDESRLAGEGRPILLVTNHGGWSVDSAQPLARRPDGAWELRLPGPEPGQTEALEFRFVLGGDGAGELDATGEPVGPRRLPRVGEKEAAGERPLVYEFTLHGFVVGPLDEDQTERPGGE